jgi:hypothetical protein
VLILASDLLYRAKPLLETAPPGPHRVLYGTDVGRDSKILRVGEMPSGARTSWVSGYLNLYQWRFDAFTAAPVVDARYFELYTRLLAAPRLADLAALPIGHVITTHQLPPPFEQVLRIGSVNVYRFADAMPMARAHAARRVIPATLEIDTSHAFVTVDTDAPAMLVLAQRNAPGWNVAVDGKPRKMAGNPMNFMAVDLAPGRHRVDFSYRPPSLAAGAATTFATLAFASIFLFVKRSRGENFFFRSHKK